MVALVATQFDGTAPGMEITPNPGDGLVLVAVASTVKSNRSTPVPLSDHDVDPTEELNKFGLLLADGQPMVTNAVVL